VSESKDSLLALGIAGLGFYGLFKLLELQEKAPRTEKPPRTPLEVKVPDIVVPPVAPPPPPQEEPEPGPDVVPTPSAYFLTSPVRLERGRRYYARVRISTLESLLPLSKTDAIRSRFESLGFRDVVVHEHPPAGWPLRAISGDMSRAYFVEGTFEGQEGFQELPNQIELAWTYS